MVSASTHQSNDADLGPLDGYSGCAPQPIVVADTSGPSDAQAVCQSCKLWSLAPLGSCVGCAEWVCEVCAVEVKGNIVCIECLPYVIQDEGAPLPAAVADTGAPTRAPPRSAVLNERSDVGNLGFLFGNWGLRAKAHNVQQNIDNQLKHGPAQIIVLAECDEKTMDVLRAPAVAANPDAEKGSVLQRKGCEYWAVRGREE